MIKIMKMPTLTHFIFVMIAIWMTSCTTKSSYSKLSKVEDDVYFSSKDIKAEQKYYDEKNKSDAIAAQAAREENYQPQITNPNSYDAYQNSRATSPSYVLDSNKRYSTNGNTTINNYYGDNRFNNNNRWNNNGWGYGFQSRWGNPFFVTPGIYYNYNGFSVGYSPFNSFNRWNSMYYGYNDPWMIVYGYNYYNDPWSNNFFNPYYSPFYNPYYSYYNDPYMRHSNWSNWNNNNWNNNNWNNNTGNNNTGGGNSGNVNRPRGGSTNGGASYINNQAVYDRPELIKKDNQPIDNRNFDWKNDNPNKNKDNIDLNSRPKVTNDNNIKDIQNNNNNPVMEMPKQNPIRTNPNPPINNDRPSLPEFNRNRGNSPSAPANNGGGSGPVIRPRR